jgi:hypothetical protein
MPIRHLSLILALVLTMGGCAGRAWRAARAEDTAAAYSRYLREHPDSKYAEVARAHLAFVRVRSRPSTEAFQEFRSQFPGSPLIEDLAPHVEDAFFEQARSLGTAEAYRRFLSEFPESKHVARASGNAAYLEEAGFGGDPVRLAGFAADHPESDYAAEAERSVAALKVRGRSAFREVGLVLDVPADVPSADRLARLFVERATEGYRNAGVSLIPMAGTTDPRLARVGARLTISHREREVRSTFQQGSVVQPGMLAETTVTLSARGQEAPIWSETFEFRVPATESVAGESILLHPRAWSQFWGLRFFAPVASWDTRLTARAARQLGAAPVAVATAGSRAVVLFGDGGFQLLDLGDPESPVVLGEYRRDRDLAHFDGVALVQDDVAVFGPDGLELVSLEGVPHRERAFSRSQVGSIIETVTLGSDLVTAGNRGLLRLAPDGSIQTLFPREVLGLARRGDRLLFTDGTSLYVASIPLLANGRVEAELRLGRGFRPARVRIAGSAALVLGDPGLVQLDVSQPAKPRVVSRIDKSEVGDIHDASVLGGRLFLIGSRGLQISDASGERIVDSVDVVPRHRLDTSGRHVVLIGDRHLQVVDTTAFTARGMPAAGN